MSPQMVWLNPLVLITTDPSRQWVESASEKTPQLHVWNCLHQSCVTTCTCRHWWIHFTRDDEFQTWRLTTRGDPLWKGGRQPEVRDKAATKTNCSKRWAKLIQWSKKGVNRWKRFASVKHWWLYRVLLSCCEQAINKTIQFPCTVRAHKHTVSGVWPYWSWHYYSRNRWNCADYVINQPRMRLSDYSTQIIQQAAMTNMPWRISAPLTVITHTPWKTSLVCVACQLFYSEEFGMLAVLTLSLAEQIKLVSRWIVVARG